MPIKLQFVELHKTLPTHAPWLKAKSVGALFLGLKMLSIYFTIKYSE